MWNWSAITIFKAELRCILFSYIWKYFFLRDFCNGVGSTGSQPATRLCMISKIMNSFKKNQYIGSKVNFWNLLTNSWAVFSSPLQFFILILVQKFCDDTQKFSFHSFKKICLLFHNRISDGCLLASLIGGLFTDFYVYWNNTSKGYEHTKNLMLFFSLMKGLSIVWSSIVIFWSALLLFNQRIISSLSWICTLHAFVFHFQFCAFVILYYEQILFCISNLPI